MILSYDNKNINHDLVGKVNYDKHVTSQYVSSIIGNPLAHHFFS